MSYQRAILIVMAILMLGQSVLVGADVHLIFEETDTHHLDHDVDMGDSHASGDDCEHSCSSHGCSMSVPSKTQTKIDSYKHGGLSHYQFFNKSYSQEPHLRPPIA